MVPIKHVQRTALHRNPGASAPGQILVQQARHTAGAYADIFPASRQALQHTATNMIPSWARVAARTAARTAGVTALALSQMGMMFGPVEGGAYDNASPAPAWLVAIFGGFSLLIAVPMLSDLALHERSGHGGILLKRMQPILPARADAAVKRRARSLVRPDYVLEDVAHHYFAGPAGSSSVAMRWHMARGEAAIVRALTERQDDRPGAWEAQFSHWDEAAHHFAQFLNTRECTRSPWRITALEKLAQVLTYGGELVTELGGWNGRIRTAEHCHRDVYLTAHRLMREHGDNHALRAFFARRGGIAALQAFELFQAETRVISMDSVHRDLANADRLFGELKDAVHALRTGHTTSVLELGIRGSDLTAMNAYFDRLGAYADRMHDLIAQRRAALASEIVQRARRDSRGAHAFAHTDPSEIPGSFPWRAWAKWRFYTAQEIATTQLPRLARMYVRNEQSLARRLYMTHAEMEPLRELAQRQREEPLALAIELAHHESVRTMAFMLREARGETEHWMEQQIRALEVPLIPIDFEMNNARLAQLQRDAEQIGARLEAGTQRRDFVTEQLSRLFIGTAALEADGANMENLRAGIVRWMLEEPNGWGPDVLRELPALTAHHPRLVQSVIADVRAQRVGWG